jgi:hypothetical protein
MTEDTLEPSAVTEPATEGAEGALAIAEKETLAELEEVIKRGRDAFIEVAEALKTIREGRLYRDTHATFEDYVRDRWSMSGAYAYQQMNAGKTVKELPPGTPKPQNEGQARELAKVPEEARPLVMEKATEATGGKLTAAAIKAHAYWREGDLIDMLPAVRFVVTDLDRACPSARRVTTMAKKYSHPSVDADALERIRAAEEARIHTPGEDPEQPVDPKVWIIRQVIIGLNGGEVTRATATRQIEVSWDFWKALPGEQVSLREEMQHDRKSNPPGLFWRDMFIRSEYEGKVNKEPPADKEPEEQATDEPAPKEGPALQDAGEEYEDTGIDPRTPLDQPDTYGAWIGTEVLDYLSRITSWTEMVAGDEIDYNGTKPDEIMVAAAGAQAALGKLIDAVTRAEELAATQTAEEPTTLFHSLCVTSPSVYFVT